jgi:hypothetical protein
MPGLSRNTRQSLKSTFRAGFQIVLFVCVSVSVWRGPIPWIHRHVDPPDGQSERLAAHRLAWHSEGSESGEWHVHFALLGDILRGEGHPVPPTEDEQQSQELFVQAIALVEQAPLSRLAWLTMLSECTAPAVALRPAYESPPHSTHSPPPRQFLAAFAIAGGLESLLCSAQC